MDLSRHALNSMVQVKLTVTLKSKDLATRGFQNIPDTPTSCTLRYLSDRELSLHYCSQQKMHLSILCHLAGQC